MPTPIYSLSIAARATLDMHSLNNEGGEGNQIQTRMVDIIGHDGQLHNVNAISGDMLKHIQAEHFFKLARERGLPLCAGCHEFNANRVNADAGFMEAIADAKVVSDAQALDAMLERCALDDVAGILVTAKGRSLPRKSVIEFGWVLGLPETADGNNQSFFHVKYANERSEAKREEDRATRFEVRNRGKDTEEHRGSGANLQQAIFHRPASSGIYAIVCHIDLARIGYNDIRQTYVPGVSEQQRALRASLLLESVMHTFVQLNGAMRSTQLPHLVRLEGALSYSLGVLPAPLVSPLAEDYRNEMYDVGRVVGNGRIQTQSFDTLSQFATSIHQLVNEAQPYRIEL